jgi:hypothetical protein
MTPTSSRPPRAPARRDAPLAAAVAVALVFAFTGGLWFADLLAGSADPGRVVQPALRAADAPPLLADDPAPVAPREAPASAAPPASAPAAAPSLLTPQGRPTPALMARVVAEATRSFEAARADLTARCVPEARRAAPGARFTFNVTFDASGREIARGIGEDRRLRAPEVASCLRALPLGAVRVSPPGAPVGVRVALTLP